MKIEESPNDVLTVKAFDNQLQPSKQLHPDLLQPPFTLLLVAPKGSGKSTTILRLIYGNRKRCADKNSHRKFYRHYFDKIFVFSPTWELDPKMQRCRIPPDQIFDDPDDYEEVVGEILDGQAEEIEAEGKDDAEEVNAATIPAPQHAVAAAAGGEIMLGAPPSGERDRDGQHREEDVP